MAKIIFFRADGKHRKRSIASRALDGKGRQRKSKKVVDAGGRPYRSELSVAKNEFPLIRTFTLERSYLRYIYWQYKLQRLSAGLKKLFFTFRSGGAKIKYGNI